ncbi:MAG: hypothetical protein OHK0040_09540 [bacterium]
MNRLSKILLILVISLLFACSTAYQQPSVYERDAQKQLERAKKAFVEGNYPKSLDYIEDAVLLANANNLPEIKIKALLQKAQLLLSLKMYNEASAVIKESKEVAEREGLQYLPYVRYSEAVYLWETGKGSEVKSVFKDIKELPDDIKPAYHNLLALVELKFDNTKSAEEEANAALKSAEKNKDYEQSSYARKVLGEISLREKKLSEAIENVKKALEIDRKTGNREALMWDLDFLGRAYKEKGEKENAFYYFYQGYELAVAIGNRAKRDYYLEQAYQLLK